MTQEPNASEVPPTAGGVSSIGPTTDPNQFMQLLMLSIQNQQLMAENSAREQQKISRLLTQQKVTNYPKMEQGADIIAFLSGFETHMDNFEVHPDQYRKYLIPALNEEGHQAIELLTAEEKADYSILRAKLLEVFNITVDTYRRRLETLKREQGERWATGRPDSIGNY